MLLKCIRSPTLYKTVLAKYAFVFDCIYKFDIWRIKFFLLQSDTSESLRDFVGIEDATPLLTAIDFPINRFSVMEYGQEITPASVKIFVSNFISNKLKFLPVTSTQELVKI